MITPTDHLFRYNNVAGLPMPENTAIKRRYFHVVSMLRDKYTLPCIIIHNFFYNLRNYI